MTTALAIRQQKLDSLKTQLAKDDVRERILSVAPAFIQPGRAIAFLLNQVLDNPRLLDCDRISLLRALFTCCQWGLYPDRVSGDAYIVPFKKEAQLIPGYRGLIKLVRRSGELMRFQAFIVREGEQFTYRHGSNPTVEHVPILNNEGAFVAAYAVAKLTNGEVQFHVSDANEIAEAKSFSQAFIAGSGTWITHEADMWRKTPSRRLCKWLPLTPEAVNAAVLDAQADAGLSQSFVELGLDPKEHALPATAEDNDANYTEQVEKELTAPTPEVVLMSGNEDVTETHTIGPHGTTHTVEREPVSPKPEPEPASIPATLETPTEPMAPVEPEPEPEPGKAIGVRSGQYKNLAAAFGLLTPAKQAAIVGRFGVIGVADFAKCDHERAAIVQQAIDVMAATA